MVHAHMMHMSVPTIVHAYTAPAPRTQRVLEQPSEQGVHTCPPRRARALGHWPLPTHSYSYTRTEGPIRRSEYKRPSPPRLLARPPVSSPPISSLALPRSPPRPRRRRAASARRWRSKQATPPETGWCGMPQATGLTRCHHRLPPCRQPCRCQPTECGQRRHGHCNRRNAKPAALMLAAAPVQPS